MVRRNIGSFLFLICIPFLSVGCPTGSKAEKPLSPSDVYDAAWAIELRKTLSSTELHFFSPQLMQDDVFKFVLRDLADEGLHCKNAACEGFQKKVRTSQETFLCFWSGLTEHLERLQGVFSVVALFPAYEASLEIKDIDTSFASILDLAKNGAAFSSHQDILENDWHEFHSSPEDKRIALPPPLPVPPPKPVKPVNIVESTRDARVIAEKAVGHTLGSIKGLKATPWPALEHLQTQMVTLNPKLAIELKISGVSPEDDPLKLWADLNAIYVEAFKRLRAHDLHFDDLLANEKRLLAALKTKTELQASAVHQLMKKVKTEAAKLDQTGHRIE